MNNYTDRLQRDAGYPDFKKFNMNNPSQTTTSDSTPLTQEGEDIRKALDEAETHLTVPMEPEVALHWVRKAKQALSTPPSTTENKEDILTCKCGEWHKKGTVCPNCGDDNRIFYIVTAYRWQNKENHSYPVGVFTNKEIAIKAAEDETTYRGGKYSCSVDEFIIWLEKELRSLTLPTQLERKLQQVKEKYIESHQTPSEPSTIPVVGKPMEGCNCKKEKCTYPDCVVDYEKESEEL